jgi:ParD-like antitoxin of type II bacterial toxin-antitoxin system
MKTQPVRPWRKPRLAGRFSGAKSRLPVRISQAWLRRFNSAFASHSFCLVPRLPPGVDNGVAFCYLMVMGQPVKMSDALVLDARLTGETAERSIAGQIEFWARLGRAIEPLLRGDRALALRRSGDAAPLSKRLGSVDTPEGRRRLTGHLKTLPYPHYEPADSPGLLVKIDADGRRTLGRFVNRRFQAVKKTGA